MRLSEEDCWRRLAFADHGVLATVHADRGVDAVPVVFALDGRRIVLPVDMVKPKSAARLQRIDNVERDPRCVLLVEHYEADWRRLWWVRVHGRAEAVEPSDHLLVLLGERHQPYREPGSIVGALVLTPDSVRGWSAGPRA